MAEESNANASKDQPVTISAPPAAVVVDPQNPLPEPSFRWRRLFAAAISANALVFVWFAAAWLVGGQQWDHLYGLTKLMIFGAGVILTYYFVAPSAAELTNMIQSAGVLKHSISLASQTASQAPSAAPSAPIRPSVAPDSQNRPAAFYGASTGPDGDVGNSDEIDAAPRGRS